jgi:hypothetical protein
MNPEDRLTEILRTDAGSHQPGDGRGGIARRLAARRRARRLRNATVPLALAVVAAVVALLVLPSGPARQKVDAANQPGTSGAGPGTLPPVTTTPPTTSAQSVSPSTTSATGGGPTSRTTAAPPSQGARLPTGYAPGGATEQNGSVYVTGVSPAAQNNGAGPAVVLRYPTRGPSSDGATSAKLAGPLAYSLGSGALWVLTGAQPYSSSTGPSTLVELDPQTLAQRGSYSLVGPAASVDAAGGFVWVGLTSGEVERINPSQPSAVTSFPAPGGGASAAVSVSLSPDASLLYEMVQQPLEVMERSASTGKVLHSASLGGPGGNTVLATGYGVWARFATGMADAVEGLTASGMTSYANIGGNDFGESSERLGDAVAGKADGTGRLYVWGVQRGGCFDLKSGSFIAAFALSTAVNDAPVAAGPDGVFQVGSQGPVKVAIPATCAAG